MYKKWDQFRNKQMTTERAGLASQTEDLQLASNQFAPYCIRTSEQRQAVRVWATTDA